MSVVPSLYSHVSKVPPGEADRDTLRALVPPFLTWLRFVRERSENTVDAYGHDLAAFLAFCDRGRLVRPDDVRPRHVDVFLAWLRQERGLKASSVNRHVHAVRSFYRWLVREDLATRNPAEGAVMLKAPRRLPKYLTVHEQERALAVLAKASSLVARRDYAMIATAILTGLRAHELATLPLAAVNLDAGVLRIVGKGDRERECVIIPRLAGILRGYLRDVRPVLMARRPASYMFLAARVGHGWKSERVIAPRVLYAAIRRRLEPILGRPVHPHVLRHSFASRLREHGAGLELIQEALGHASITTTVIYSHITDAKRKADVAKYLEGRG